MKSKWLPGLGFVLASGWFIFVFRHYLPELTRAGIRSVLSSFSARDSILLDIVVVLCIWLSSWVVGSAVLARLRLPRFPRIERFLFASSLGISFWSLAALVLAASRLFYAHAFYALMILVLVLGAGRIRRAAGIWYRNTITALSSRLSVTGFVLVALGLFIVLVLSVFFLSALAPEIEFDARLTHLTAAKIYAETHRLAAIPDIPQTFFPRHVTMLFAVGMVMKGEACAKLIEFVLGVLCLLVGYAMAARISGRFGGWIAAAILASSPLLLWEMRTAHLELGLTLYVSLALFATALWLTGEGQRFWWLGAYFLAFAQGTKYHALWALVTLPIVVLLFRIGKGGVRAALLDSARLALLGAMGLLPWGLVNLVQTGNPLFPFLNEIFRSPNWTPALTAYGANEMSSAGLNKAEDWLKLPGFLWYMATDQSGRFRGNIGPFYLLLLPLFLIQRRWPSQAKIFLLFSALYSIVWLFAAQHARYFLPLLPGLAAVCAVGLVSWIVWLNRANRVLSALAVILLFSLAVFNSPLFERLGANAWYGSVSITDKLPLAYLAGAETKDQYLSRWIPSQDAVLYFNRLPGPKKVLFWWTAPNFLAVENGGFACYYSPCFPELQGDDPAHLRQVLSDNHVTHFIVDQSGQEQAPATRPDGPFAQAYLKRIFKKNGVILYEIEDQPGHHDSVVYDFLSHLTQAEFQLPSVPTPVDGPSLRTFADVAGVKRWAMAMPQGEAKFSVHVPKQPVLKCAVGAQMGECTETSPVEITVESGKGETSLFSGTVNAAGWQDVVANLAAFADQDVKLIFRIKPTRFAACGVYYWADPILISAEQGH